MLASRGAQPARQPYVSVLLTPSGPRENRERERPDPRCIAGEVFEVQALDRQRMITVRAEARNRSLKQALLRPHGCCAFEIAPVRG